MSETINIEQAVLDNLRILPPEKKQEVLDFVEFLLQKLRHKTQLDSEFTDSIAIQQETKLSLQEIAKLPVGKRHQLLAPFIVATAEDFLNDPELTEFSVLDGEDWEIEYD